MSSLLASLLRDSVSEFIQVAEDKDEEKDDDQKEDDDLEISKLSPSLQSALRLIKSNPHLIMQDDDDTPNIFYSLHSFLVTEAILHHYPELVRATRASKRDTPLHAACAVQNVSVETIRLLLTLAPDSALKQQGDGKLPIHVAAANPTTSVKIFKLLSNINPEGIRTLEPKNGSYPLHYACAFKAPLDTIEALILMFPDAIKARDKQNNLPLHLSLLYSSSPGVIFFLLEQYPESIAEPDGKGRLALHLATTACHEFEVIKQILDLHPQAAAVAVDGRKPIHFAIRQKGRVDVISALLAACNALGADISTAGDTLLHSALEYSAPIEVVKAIIDTDKDAIHEVNADGKLPIHFACWHQSDVAILSLLIATHPPYVQTKEPKGGMLPLHYAIQYAPQGERADVRPALLLLEHYPAAVFEPTAKGLFAIHLAARNKCPMRLLEALLKICPYSVGFEDKDPHAGLLPLDYALKANSNTPGFDTVSRLLGVDLRGDGKDKSDKGSTMQSSSDGQFPSPPKKAPPSLANKSPATPTPSLTSPFARASKDDDYDEDGDGDGDGDGEEKQMGVKEALLDLQRRYKDQGEEIRRLRKKHHDQTLRLQKCLKDIKGLQHDVSWRDDKIRITERELDLVKKELDSYK